jgi:Fe-S cluster biogenesis protein NfuA
MGFFGSLMQKWFGHSTGNPLPAETAATTSKENHFHIERVQPTPNPDAFQFIMNQKVIVSGTKTFNSADEAKGDPLGEALFNVFGVENVFFKENFVTITKSKVVGWHAIMDKLGECLEEKLTVCQTPDHAEPVASHVLENFNKEDFVNCSDEEKTRVIEELLNVAIRPALANDGGGLDIIGIEGNTLSVHYQGACGSCPSSTTGTLTYIETFLQEALHPDIKVQAS